jgi:hypothetical protein
LDVRQNTALTTLYGDNNLFPSKTAIIGLDEGRMKTFKFDPQCDLSADSAAAWAREGVNSAIAKGFVPIEIRNDYTSVIRRREFCRMAVKFVEYRTGKTMETVLQEKGLSIDPGDFSDTSDFYILAACALGITSGTGDGKFFSNGRLTREQAATMLMNTCKALGMDVSNPPTSDFTDLDAASSWAVDGINFVRANGIMNGTSADGSVFTPKATYTRQESIVAFDRIP